jgi:hypothetical protein
LMKKNQSANEKEMIICYWKSMFAIMCTNKHIY